MDYHPEVIKHLQQHIRMLDQMSKPTPNTVTEFSAKENIALAVKFHTAISALQAPQAQHPDDVAVDAFAAAMKDKMAKQRAKGYSGWEDPSKCPAMRLKKMLVDHIAKGDPVDVGNFAMMLFYRGESTWIGDETAPEPVKSCATCKHETPRATMSESCYRCSKFYDSNWEQK